MAKLTEQQKSAVLAATRTTAHALSDDLKYMRKIVSNDPFNAGDLRRLSNQLRRILVNGDLRTVAGPRVGKIRINAPQLKLYHQFNDKQKFHLFSGGNLNLHGLTISNVLMVEKSEQGLPVQSPDETLSLNVEQFISQRVICFKGRWATRTDVIKYVGIVAHGIHSSDVRNDPQFEFLDTVKQFARVMLNEQHPYLVVNTDAVKDTSAPWKIERDQVDLTLIQLMSTAQYLVSSPEVLELEKLIDKFD